VEQATERTRVGFSFTNHRTSSSSSRLAEVVEDKTPLNVDALAARAFGLPPTTPCETPYVGVSCALYEGTSNQERATTTPADAPRVLRRALEDAVARTLGDARRVAVMAGGGLDSAGLLALTVAWARPRGATVFAVALDFAGRCDDRPYLRMLEQRLACEVIRVQPEEGAPHLEWGGGVDGAPFCWPGAPIEIAMMRRARSHGADCVLMGVGGDELFDGEPQSLAAVARRGNVLSAVRSARSMRGFQRPRSRTLSWIARPLLGRITPTSIRMRLARRRPGGAPSWAGPRLVEYVERVRQRDLVALERNLRGGVVVDPEAGERHRVGVGWIRHQEEVVAGVERRDPFFDADLMATVDSFEPEWMLAGDIRRGLFREAHRDLLPAALLGREDKAFFEPAFGRLVGGRQGLEAMRDLASCDELAELGIVDRALFAKEFDAFVAAPDEGLPWLTIWPALCVEQFLRARRAS
jgi:asparagine synthetase B (glutamine-hydrolysing)